MWNAIASYFVKKPDYLLDAECDASLPLPPGFRIRFESKNFLEHIAQSHKGFTTVGVEGCWGLRWPRGPLIFEQYISDKEPVLEKKPHRFVFWQPITRRDIPTGWHRAWFFSNHVRMIGFTEITDPVRYYRSWSDHGQRQRRQFLNKQKNWEICNISLDEFLKGYVSTKKKRSLKFLYTWVVREEQRIHGSCIRIIGMRRHSTHALEAAAAFIDIPEIKQSYYLASFVLENAKKDLAMLGLLDYWFRTAPEKGITFLDFGAFWAPGDPLDWRGFSIFKNKFGVRYLRYPARLLKII